MFEHARDHLPLYRALIGSDGAAVSLCSIRQIIADLVRTEIGAESRKAAKADTSRELKVQFVTGAFMAVLTWWMDEGATLPPGEVDGLFRSMATDGIFREGS